MKPTPSVFLSHQSDFLKGSQPNPARCCSTEILKMSPEHGGIWFLCLWGKMHKNILQQHVTVIRIFVYTYILLYKTKTGVLNQGEKKRHLELNVEVMIE